MNSHIKHRTLLLFFSNLMNTCLASLSPSDVHLSSVNLINQNGSPYFVFKSHNIMLDLYATLIFYEEPGNTFTHPNIWRQCASLRTTGSIIYAATTSSAIYVTQTCRYVVLIKTGLLWQRRGLEDRVPTTCPEPLCPTYPVSILSRYLLIDYYTYYNNKSEFDAP